MLPYFVFALISCSWSRLLASGLRLNAVTGCLLVSCRQVTDHPLVADASHNWAAQLGLSFVLGWHLI